ncbi:MAG: ABC transporter permease, partial [Firmicutes bacterium]|nr:ABC transporter permease [Bacillota bacterium]
MIYLVTSGLKAQHRNSYLGYFWWLLDPLLGIGIYYFLMVVLLGRGDSPGYGGFLVVGMVVWRWLSSTVNASAKSIVRQAGIVS